MQRSEVRKGTEGVARGASRGRRRSRTAGTASALGERSYRTARRTGTERKGGEMFFLTSDF